MAYKILSLDGGGSWALIQARVLLDIYGDISGHELLNKYDMAIANSGGSLVLACLCNDMALSKIIAVFEQEDLRKEVFSHLKFAEELKNVFSLVEKVTGFGPKYSTERKIVGIRDVLTKEQGTTKQIPKPPIVDRFLDELPALIGKPDLQIVIVGYDYFRRRANFFRSNTHSNTNKFSPGFNRITLGNAIHASSNAPVNYFNEPATVQTVQAGLAVADETRTTWYWDGAISGFNNPVLAGLIEAITNNSLAMDQYRILSIGTGTGDRAIITDYDGSSSEQAKKIYHDNLHNPLVQTDHSFNFLHDVKELATSILGDPPDSATFIAYSIVHPDLTPNGNIVRISPCYKPELKAGETVYTYPDVYNADDQSRKDFITLLDLDMDAVEQDQVNLITALCDKFIIHDTDTPRLTNQLIRGQDTTNCLGDMYYHEAKKRWGDLTGD